MVYNPEEVLTGEAPDPEQVESDLPADSGGSFDLMAEEAEDDDDDDDEVSQWFSHLISETGFNQSEEPVCFQFRSSQSLTWTMFFKLMLT